MIRGGVIYHITLAEANGPLDLSLLKRVQTLAPLAVGDARIPRYVLFHPAVGAVQECGTCFGGSFDMRGVGFVTSRLR